MRRSYWIKIVLLAAAFLGVLIFFVSIANRGIAARQQLAPNRTFFEQFVIAGGPIVWFVLLPTSLLTLYLAVVSSLIIRRKTLLPGEAAARISSCVKRCSLTELPAHLAGGNDLLSAAFCKVVTKGRSDGLVMRSDVIDSLQDEAFKLSRRVEWLNLIGNVCPMVGLFGTVFGMIKLFNAIVLAQGQPEASQLADGISVALVTTFWGLFIAIPALAIYGIFRNRIETLISEAVEQAELLLPQIRGALKAAKTSPVLSSTQQGSPIKELKSQTVKSSKAVPERFS